MQPFIRIVLLTALLSICTVPSFAQGMSTNGETSSGSLGEIKNKRHLALIVMRSMVVDSRGSARTAVDLLSQRDTRWSSVHELAYRTIVVKLNRYMNKYGSLMAEENVEHAELILLFNIIKVRVFDKVVYPLGEMFVIANATAGSGGTQPRIVWRQKKDIMWVGDSIGDLIKALKSSRGEK